MNAATTLKRLKALDKVWITSESESHYAEGLTRSPAPPPEQGTFGDVDQPLPARLVFGRRSAFQVI